MHGALTGIVVTQHGVSPRILQAQVVGSRGTATVTGGQLQAVFGLATTDAAFTTITTTALVGDAARIGVPRARPRQRDRAAAERGGLADARTRARSQAGRFVAPLPAAGRYRITYRSLGGPAVTG